jgi:hypothetical protein
MKLEEYNSICFVFGSNLAGRHGAGAAKHAQQSWGAKHGVGFGHCGYSYAIPTKDAYLNVMPLPLIAGHAERFIEFAKQEPGIGFKVTKIGCGYAGYSNEDMAPLFTEAPSNCHFDSAWLPFLPEGFNAWGSYDDK